MPDFVYRFWREKLTRTRRRDLRNFYFAFDFRFVLAVVALIVATAAFIVLV
ncbi:MAG: hypothetical protein ACK4K7_05480 [Allosphingosinicella sp.]|uniref:hypothetical protein n=1 Tax=Allosphingosinicella sp. TaxID=2823234 RepID=UPI00392A89D6